MFAHQLAWFFQSGHWFESSCPVILRCLTLLALGSCDECAKIAAADADTNMTIVAHQMDFFIRLSFD